MKQWTEKYRPRKFEDMVGNERNVEFIKKLVDSGDTPPHLLLIGPYGLGKTTIAHVIKDHLFGAGGSADFKELNAGDERTIQIIREDVDNYMKQAPIGNHPFVMLFIDEIDRITPDAQMALNRKVEVYGGNCWIVACANSTGRMNRALISRFQKLDFGLPTAEDILKRLKVIVEQEEIEIEEELEEIARRAEHQVGSVRWAINALQCYDSGLDIVETSIIDNLLSMDSIDLYDLINGMEVPNIFSQTFNEIFVMYRKDKNLLFELVNIWSEAEKRSQYSYLPVGHVIWMFTKIAKRLEEEK